jgi:dolichyl-phosphate beta-glucosyltransferase
MYLSWIIPTYNEERRIAKTLREVDRYLASRRFPGGYEIIVSDSASRDRTIAVVEGMKPEIPNLRAVSVERRGKGLGVKAGMLAAHGDIRIFSDADNSTAPEYFDVMAPLFQAGHDVVISSRDPKDAPGASRDIKEPWYRELLGNLGNLVIQVVGGIWGIWDTQNGFKAFTAPAAREIFHRSIIRGWAFDIEVLALARKLGYRTGVIPVRWKFDPDSRLGLGVYLEVLGDVFRVRWNFLANRYRIRT